MAAIASYHPTPNFRRNHHLSPPVHTTPLPPTYSPLSSGLPSPSFPSPIPLPARGRSPTPHPSSSTASSRHPSRQQSVRRLSTISSAFSRTPSTINGQHRFVDHRDFSTIAEEILSEGDIVGQGDNLHGETIELVHIPTEAARPEQHPPAVHLRVIRKLGAGSYAVVYLVKEILGRSPKPRAQPNPDAEELSDSETEEDMWVYEYGRDFAVKCLSKASLSPEELDIQMFEVSDGFVLLQASY